MGSAMDQAQAAITGIIDLIDPVKKTNVHLDDILTVLGLGLMLIPVVGPEAELGVASALAINTLIVATQQVPSLAKVIWPVGTVDSQAFQIDQLTDEFSGSGGIRSNLQANLATMLQIVQGFEATDVSAFLAFTGQGIFSVPSPVAPSVTASSVQQQQALLQVFTTFLTTTALADNGWTSIFLPGVDALGLHNGTASCPSWAGSGCNQKTRDIGCESLDGFNQCDNTYWWYSES